MASFEEVQDVCNHPEVYLIDVRNKEEIATTGTIPCSINIPLHELAQSLELADDDFKAQFDRPKPSRDAPLIFSCLRGGRAQKAADLATNHGFKNAKPYLGSWTEWTQKIAL